MNNTASDSIVSESRLSLFPPSLVRLSDTQWVRAIADYIVADLPRLSDDDRQVVYEDLIDLRIWTYRQAAAA